MIPSDRMYTKSHEWAKIEGDVAIVGISHFAQEQLGDLTFVDLPRVGDQVSAGAEMGSVESVKAASELYSPVTGEVLEVNEELASAPEKVNQDPYGAGWMLKVKLTAAPEGLLDAAAYEQVAAASAH
ncbi:MAG: glycine cleavage system protein GcvH [Desulfovibrio aminophilus]|uniref:glycine cleavage system protein GcvH n=1 Tax=Desulfovibrio aminophilus TaxID=81425 RepID=UPI000403FEF1|nr:glycine cleavage system protein GcvH [Desulfovibrio aminophilus]